MSRPRRDPVEEQLVGLRLGSGAREPLIIGGSGPVFLRLGFGWHRLPGRSQGLDQSVSVNQESGGLGSPQALGRGCRRVWLGRVLFSEGAREHTQWVSPSSPRTILEGSVGGLLHSETIGPEA